VIELGTIFVFDTLDAVALFLVTQLALGGTTLVRAAAGDTFHVYAGGNFVTVPVVDAVDAVAALALAYSSIGAIQ
jgi:hypothetical protein